MKEKTSFKTCVSRADRVGHVGDADALGVQHDDPVLDLPRQEAAGHREVQEVGVQRLHRLRREPQLQHQVAADVDDRPEPAVHPAQVHHAALLLTRAYQQLLHRGGQLRREELFPPQAVLDRRF